MIVLRLFTLRVALPIATRRIPLPRLVRFLACSGTAVRVQEQRVATRAAARLWSGSDSPCLERSLALYGELGRLGADVALVCGIDRTSERRIGHAWVERSGVPLLELGDPRDAHEPLVVFDRHGHVVEPGVTTVPDASPPTTPESRPAHALRATQPATRRRRPA